MAVVIGGRSTNNIDTVVVRSMKNALPNAGTVVVEQDQIPGIRNINGMARNPNNGRIVAVGNSASGGGAIYSTNNGSSWRLMSMPSGTPTLLDVCWAPSANMFVAVGEGGAIRTVSATGTSWSTRNSGVTNDLNGVTAGPSRIFAVGSIGHIRQSTNGTSWSMKPGSNSAPFSTLIMNNIEYDGRASTPMIAVGGYGSVATFSSETASHVTRTTPTGTQGLSALCFANSAWFAAGYTNLITSNQSGISWINRSHLLPPELPISAWITDLVYDPYSSGRLVALASGNVVVGTGSPTSSWHYHQDNSVGFQLRGAVAVPTSPSNRAPTATVLQSIGGDPNADHDDIDPDWEVAAGWLFDMHDPDNDVPSDLTQVQIRRLSGTTTYTPSILPSQGNIQTSHRSEFALLLDSSTVQPGEVLEVRARGHDGSAYTSWTPWHTFRYRGARLQRWTGSAWVTNEVRARVGSNWVSPKTLRRWTGSAWVDARR